MPIEKIKNVFKSDSAVGGLYVGLVGAWIGEIAPSPTDILDFYWERTWRIQLEKGEIDAKTYWRRITAKYYFLDSSYWLLLLGVAVAVGGDIKRKATVIGGIVGAGMAIGVIGKNIQKDTKYFENYKLVTKEEYDRLQALKQKM
jgi:hypothetical protein